MNKIKALFSILRSETFSSLEFLMKATGFTERKIRTLISELRSIGKRKGFDLQYKKNRGYFLEVKDEDAFSNFIADLENDTQIDVSDKNTRMLFTMYYLLNSKGFATKESIAQLLDVSLRTITNDLTDIKKTLAENNLTLFTKKHYGIKVTGDEWDIRKFFSKITSRIQNQNGNFSLNENYAELKRDVEIKKVLVDTFTKNSILMTPVSIDSILMHLWILLLRVKERNYVAEISVNEEVISRKYYAAANDIISYLEEKYDMEVSKQEVDLLASQLFGKSILEETPVQTKSEMIRSITEILEKIDAEYDSDYAKDEQLIEGLLLHIYPLIMRLSFGLELNNALIHILPAQYTSAFLMAIRFVEFHPELQQYSLSRDEIGYLALHFANHQEKMNLKRLQNIRSIVVIYENMRGDSGLLKVKLQMSFPNANIRLVPSINIKKYNLDDVDLILTTNRDLEIKKQFLMISEPVDDNEINRIRNVILYDYNDLVHKSIRINDLFFESLYFHEQGDDYLGIVRKYALLLEKDGWAKEGYADLVIERETRINTIYENGIAGPHSITPYAQKDCIVIIILDNDVHYQGKKVNCIFLINFRSGHMILHQSVSKFIVGLMKDGEKVKRINRTESFDEFLNIAEE